MIATVITGKITNATGTTGYYWHIFDYDGGGSSFDNIVIVNEIVSTNQMYLGITTTAPPVACSAITSAENCQHPCEWIPANNECNDGHSGSGGRRLDGNIDYGWYDITVTNKGSGYQAGNKLKVINSTYTWLTNDFEFTLEEGDLEDKVLADPVSTKQGNGYVADKSVTIRKDTKVFNLLNIVSESSLRQIS